VRKLFYGYVVSVVLQLVQSQGSYADVVGLEVVGTNGTLSLPTFVTHAPGDRNRLFVAQLSGTIKVIDLATNQVLLTPFLTIPATDIRVEGEGGLLGLAFHPDYFSTDNNNPGRGKFYVYVTVDNNLPEETSPFSSHIREYSVIGDPATSNIANATFTREILSFTQPQNNHNGGWIGFNPKLSAEQPQYLYIASGDGGAGYDTGPGHTDEPDVKGNAQDITDNLLGKMLRIDVDGDDFPGANPEALAKNYAIPPTNPLVGVEGDDEILAYGLRNPFRASFDRLTGDLWIGDVGQDNREEIDVLPASRTEVANFGWRLREGDISTPGVGGPVPDHYAPPVYSYTHPDTTVPPTSPAEFDGVLVTGGYVYRGPDPSLQGKYFFLDSRSSNSATDDNYWMVDANPFGTVMNIDSLLQLGIATQFPVSFGEDAVGNLYIAYLVSGQVQRIATSELLRGDFDADGDVDGADYHKWRAGLGEANLQSASDGNGNGIFDAADYVAWRNNLGMSVYLGSGTAFDRMVPEPAAGLSLLSATAIIVLCGRRPRRCRTRSTQSTINLPSPVGALHRSGARYESL
jgi:hypothetical protein